MPLPFVALIPLISAAVSAAGGMGMQASANKQRRKENQEAQRNQIEAQKEMNRNNQGMNLDMWKNTSYGAQREQMEKAGLNVGMMYGQGAGSGGTMGNASGSAGMGQVEDQGKARRDMMGMGLQAGMQLALMKAQKDNIEADTANKVMDTTNKEGGNAGIVADSKGKQIAASLSEQTYIEQLEKIKAEADVSMGEGKKRIADGEVAQRTIDARVEQEVNKAIQIGVETKAKQAGIALTEEQTKETTAKIGKIVAEVERMKELTEVAKQEMLTKKMQMEFNTSTAEQIKQWTEIGTDILRSTKGGGSTNKNTTIDNRRINNTETNHWE